jgi:cytochrome c-type biogenesis protein CcmF
VALRPDPWRDLYLALGQEQDSGAPDGSKTHVVRFQIHPLAPWIWIGGLIVALGGALGALLSALDLSRRNSK